MRATIKIIAERAGVSIGTVDRVLHDRPYVKEEVRRRVLEVMEELDYRPNRMASALATSGLTRQFAIIQPTWESYVGAAMAAGVEKFRRERQDYNVHVTVYPYPQGQTEACLRLLDQAAEETQGIALCAADCPPVRQKLEEHCFLTAPQVARKQVSAQDGTIKYLWRLSDGNCIETVLMRYKHGNTVCISCQVGCRMGCAFCASTLGGKVRDLTPAEMVDQVLFTQLDSGEPVSNIVLMGIGEPLDNMDTVLKFLTLVNQPNGLNIGMRHISLSTCGLADQIDKLAQHRLQLTLSVSLHAPDDETRSHLMPVNRSVGVEKLMAACRRYFQTTGRRISYEYAMIDGVNDSDWQADLLARLLKGTPGHVNLIPLNDVEESPLKPSRRVAAFQRRLEGHGVTVTVRRKLGGDIDASCGQLRRKAMAQTLGRNDGRKEADIP